MSVEVKEFSVRFVIAMTIVVLLLSMLRISGTMQISWLTVFAPYWLPVALIIAGFIAIIALAAIAEFIEFVTSRGG